MAATLDKKKSAPKPAAAAKATAQVPGGDRIAHVKLSLASLPLPEPISDAKVLTGRQRPLTHVAFSIAEITTRDGHTGMGFGYSKRAGGPGMYAHGKEIANDLIGEDPNDIHKVHTKLLWMGASMGRSGMTTQAITPFDIALWDLKARRAKLPLAKLIGSHRDSVRLYNTSGGFLHTPLPQVLKNVEACVKGGIGGIKIKVGQPDFAEDLKRVSAVRKLLGDGFPLMVDANQQWNRTEAMKYCRRLEPLDLVWIEEPLDSYDAEGHAELARALDTPIATGEMLTSFQEHARLIEAGASDWVQPDAPRVGGITPFLQILQLMEYKGLSLAPHFAMEIHVHLAATFSREPWTEHFEWLEPMFNERLEIREGRMHLPDRPGHGFTLSQQTRKWTTESVEFGKRP